MSKISIFDAKGKAKGDHAIHEAIAASDVSIHVLHRAVVTEESNKRQGTQKTKSRSEARGGGRKPYKQKKTGNARQGTIRAPHYAHGGMALALTPRDHTKGLNKKERRLAIIGAFAQKSAAGEVIAVDKIAFTEPKTKHAVALLESLGLANVRRVLIVLAEHDPVILRCFRNLPNVVVRTAPNREGKGEPFSTRDLIVAHKVVFTKAALEASEAAWIKPEAGQ
jgi:large subunit ribosomal protein L4